MRIRGEGGEVRAGPHLAAVLGRWSLDRTPEAMDGGRWSFAGAVLSRDAFWSAHGGALDLVVPVGAVSWAWRGVPVGWGGESVSVAGIGKPEVR